MSQRARPGDVIVLTIPPSMDAGAVAQLLAQGRDLEERTGVKTIIVGGGVNAIVARRALDEDVERALDVLERIVTTANESILRACGACSRAILVDEDATGERIRALVAEAQQALAAVELADASEPEASPVLFPGPDLDASEIIDAAALVSVRVVEELARATGRQQLTDGLLRAVVVAAWVDGLGVGWRHGRDLEATP